MMLVIVHCGQRLKEVPMGTVDTLMLIVLLPFLDANRIGLESRAKVLLRALGCKSRWGRVLTGAAAPARTVSSRAVSSRVRLESLLRYFGRRKRFRCPARTRPARSH
jgi:hypothetical protein